MTIYGWIFPKLFYPMKLKPYCLILLLTCFALLSNAQGNFICKTSPENFSLKTAVTSSYNAYSGGSPNATKDIILNEEEITVFPNPATMLLRLNTGNMDFKGNATITIYNSSGQKMLYTERNKTNIKDLLIALTP